MWAQFKIFFQWLWNWVLSKYLCRKRFWLQPIHNSCVRTAYWSCCYCLFFSVIPLSPALHLPFSLFFVFFFAQKKLILSRALMRSMCDTYTYVIFLSFFFSTHILFTFRRSTLWKKRSAVRPFETNYQECWYFFCCCSVCFIVKSPMNSLTNNE